VVSRSGVGLPTAVPSPSGTLAGFTHPSVQIKPPVPRSNTAPSLALARSARWCLACDGGRAGRGMPSAPRQASWAKAYTWSGSAGTRCGLEVQPWLPPVRSKPVVSRSARTDGGKGGRLPHSAVVVMRKRSTPAASRLWASSQATKLVLVRARSAQVVLCKQPSNPSLQGTVQQRRCRCRPAPELWRWAIPGSFR
jgi:hypothetical protein